MLFISDYTADVIFHQSISYDGVNFIQKPFSKYDLESKDTEE